jgi:hypothetical protein
LLQELAEAGMQAKPAAVTAHRTPQSNNWLKWKRIITKN